MDVLLAYFFVHCMHIWCLRKPEEGVGSPGTRVTGGFELNVSAGNGTLCPLEEQSGLLSTVPFLQSRTDCLDFG